MDNIYTGIELGTNSIKIVVLLKHNKEYHVLASVCSASSGIKNGQITDTKKALSALKDALKKVKDMLGIPITKAILCVPPTNCVMDIIDGKCEVNDRKVTGLDVSNVLKNALKGKSFNDYELITVIPIVFKVDDKENIHDPRGIVGDVIEAKIVISMLPKESLYRILQVLRLASIEVVDVTYTSTGDYYTAKTKRYDMLVGAVINIGECATNVSIFNKGIQIKHSIIPNGSCNVDRDIGYVFKLDLKDSRNLKENFAVSMSNYADANDVVEVKNQEGERKEISQIGISKVVEARIREILNLAKSEIKDLTNRKISYIIITGGLSELAGFSYLISDEFGDLAKVCNISIMGLRHNKYSSVIGAIKYFDDKLELRDKSMSMFDNNDINELISEQQKTTTTDNFMSKVFGHFFDN